MNGQVRDNARVRDGGRDFRGVPRRVARAHDDTRTSLRIAGLATILALTSACGPSAPRPLNVAVIVLDTLRADSLGCYGYARPTSPNIDRWAAGSVVFENAQSAAPWTAPSLISLMTSLYPSVHGVVSYDEPGVMSERVVTLAESLASQSYRTGAFTEGGYAVADFGLGQGFETYENAEIAPREPCSEECKSHGRLHSNVAHALDWVEARKDEPFFLFFHTYETHTPFAAPEEFVRRFRPDWDARAEHERLANVRQRWNQAHEIDAAGLQLLAAHREHCAPANDLDLRGLEEKMRECGVGALDPERLALWRDLYDAEVRYTDAELKPLLARLSAADLRENTIVVLVSDHGEAFGEHGRFGHGAALHEELLRVPLIVRAPNVAPRRVRDLVRTVDVMPTLLELLDATPQSHAMQGRSLRRLLTGQSLRGEPSFSHALGQPGREARLWSVREGPWRLVWDEERRAAQLFDLARDPQELSDVAATHADVVARLMGALRAQCAIEALYVERAAGPAHTAQVDVERARELLQLGYTDSMQLPTARQPARGLARPSFCGS